MEKRASYQTAAPQRPRNLAAGLAEWLPRLDFVPRVQESPTYVELTAHWVSPRFERFELTYTWSAGPVPEATVRLRVLYHALGPQEEVLFTAQRVRRLKEVRLLLLGNLRLHNARLLARPAVPVPTAPLTPSA